MHLWRTTLAAGESTYVWHRREPDGTTPTYRLGDETLTPTDWVRHPQWYTRSVQAALTIPPDWLPGDYLLSDGTASLPIQVTAPLAARPSWVTVQPGDDLSARAAAGYNLRLAAGTHVLEHEWDAWYPQGAPLILHGSGPASTTLVLHQPLRPYHRLTLRDLTLQPTGYAFTHTQPIQNVRLERVHFQGGEFGEFPSPGLLVQDCRFEETRLAKLTAGLFLRCRFWRCGINSRGSAGLALLDCDFENGGLNFGGGTVRDCLFHALHFHGTQGRDNGSEVVLVEGAAHLKDCLFTNLRVRGGEGVPFQVYEAAATGNLVWDFALAGGGTTGRALWFYSTAQHDQSGNRFLHGELHGGRVDFGMQARDNLLRGVGLVHPRPGRGNQLSWHRPEWYGPQTLFQAAPGTHNRVEDSAVVGLPSGWQLTDHCVLERVQVG